MNNSRRNFLLGGTAAVVVCSVPIAKIATITAEAQPRLALYNGLVYWMGPEKFYTWDGTVWETIEA